MSTAEREIKTDPGGDVVEVQHVDDISALSELTRAEVDVQVETAKKYPRSIQKAKEDAVALATQDQDTAQSMYYSLPRGEKRIEGPSVRFAEVMAYAWGNLRVEGRVVDVGERFVTAQGVCWDLEKNTGARVEVRRRITDKHGNRYGDDMIGVTSNAAVSVALRNAVFRVIPFALAKSVYDRALKTATESDKSMNERRKDWVAYWKDEHGVELRALYRVLGIGGQADIGVEEIRHMIGMRNSIEDGETTAGQMFAGPGATEQDTRRFNEEVMAGADEAENGRESDEGSASGGDPPGGAPEGAGADDEPEAVDPRDMERLDLDDRVPSGKYKGETWRHVVKRDPEYAEKIIAHGWILDEDVLRGLRAHLRFREQEAERDADEGQDEEPDEEMTSEEALRALEETIDDLHVAGHERYAVAADVFEGEDVPENEAGFIDFGRLTADQIMRLVRELRERFGVKEG